MGSTEDLAPISSRISFLFEMLLQSGRISHQSDFAEKLGVNRITLRSYLNNQREPGVRFLITLHKTFRVNLNWLITGDGPMFSADEFSRLEKAFMKLEDNRRAELIHRSENIEREYLEYEKMISTITMMGYESEKRVILEERAEGILRNLHAKRIEMLGMKSRLFTDRKKRGSQKPLLTPAPIIEVENRNIIKNLNQQINDFVLGKSLEFKNLINQINNIIIS